MEVIVIKKFLENLTLYFEINFWRFVKENNFKKAIDNIDSKKSEKIMYKIIKEYLYLKIILIIMK